MDDIKKIARKRMKAIELASALIQNSNVKPAIDKNEIRFSIMNLENFEEDYYTFKEIVNKFWKYLDEVDEDFFIM